MSMKIYLISIMTFLVAVTPLIACAENVNQIKNLMQADRSSYTKETKITDPNKLFKELENYDSYRPDSYSHAVRNPFGDKRYRNLKFTTED